MIRGWLLILAVTVFPYPGEDPRAEQLTVFSASSLTELTTEIGERFMDRTGTSIRTANASSSQLARKIEFGATADIFLSADRRWTDYLAELGLIGADSTHPFAGNRLVLIRPKPKFPDSVEGLEDLTGLRDRQRIAIGNPDHVPVGRYAKEALENMGLWHGTKRHLAAMPNARAALALVERGEVTGGIVYWTDSLISRSVEVVAEIPARYHRPIRYIAAITQTGMKNSASRAFVDFLLSSEVEEIFEKHGFTVVNDGG